MAICFDWVICRDVFFYSGKIKKAEGLMRNMGKSRGNRAAFAYCVLVLCMTTVNTALADELIRENVSTQNGSQQTTGFQFGYELDPYYSSASWIKNFSNEDIPEIDDLNELNIYQTLISDSLTPDFILFELSVNPLPILGTYLRSQMPSLYKDGRGIGMDGQLVESVTAGFEEPFALSAFAGRVVRFAPPEGMESKGDNMGYIGYLLTVGSQHIQNNVLIQDNWAEVEWKIKGKRDTKLQFLSWSMRLGAKFHEHVDISNTFMVGIRRDRIDYSKNKDSFFRDIGFEYRLDVLQHNLDPSRQQLIVDKHWPLEEKGLTLSLGFGAVWEGNGRYTGALAKEARGLSWVFRPNIRF